MNFSTKDVLQMFVLEEDATIAKKDTPDGKGIQIVITHADGSKETTDVINKDTVVVPDDAIVPADDEKALKVYTVTAKAGTLVAGQEYVICVQIRDAAANEVSFEKIASVIATAAMVSTPADFYAALKNALALNSKNDVDQFFTLSSSANGLVITEAVPHWKLGSFPERLADINITGETVWVSGAETQWINIVQSTGASLPNSKKVADMEYFSKGEKGLSNGKENWPDNIEPTLYAKGNLASGYYILNLPNAYVGFGAQSHRSEKDVLFASETKAPLTTILGYFA